MSRKSFWTALGLFAAGILTLILVFIVLFLSSLQHQVDVARASCVSTQKDVIIPIANGFRTVEEADRARANLKTAATGRSISKNEYQKLENLTLLPIDHHIDPKYDTKLNPVGKAIIGNFGPNTYSCIAAHPNISFLGIQL